MATQFINQTDLDAAFKNYSAAVASGSFSFESTISPEVTSLSTASSTPSPVDREGKPVKKRRSWGQQLPTPTTNLPPRKRAKTEAEKEQRRIERVIRNRLAAHSSRERKRKEVECLEDQKQVIESENRRLKQQLAVLASKNRVLQEENMSLRAELGRPVTKVEPPSPTIEESIKEEPEIYNAMPSPPSSNESYTVDPRDSLSPSPTSPATDVHDFITVSSDSTQHPAVSVPGSTGKQIKDDARPLSRRSSISVSLTTASTCHSSPGPVEDSFDDLFGTAIETPATVDVSFEDSFLTGMPSKAEQASTNLVEPSIFDAMVDFDADPMMKHAQDDFVNFDQHDFHDQDHFVIFSSSENP